jgi:phospholipase/carboxylesterase
VEAKPVQNAVALEADASTPFSAKVEAPLLMLAEKFVNLPFAGLNVHERGTPLAQAKRVVVLFHGYGADGTDLVGLAGPLSSEGTAFLFPEAPIELRTGGRAWFTRDRSDFEQGYQRALALLQVLIRDHAQLEFVIGGFSQGAMLTSNLLADAPIQVQGALIFSPANLLTHLPGPASRRLPLLLSHGTLDQVLPFSEGEALRDRFRAWGYPVTWVPFVGPHTITREVLAEARELLASLPVGTVRPDRSTD